jgi:hypothetical protein
MKTGEWGTVVCPLWERSQMRPYDARSGQEPDEVSRGGRR